MAIFNEVQNKIKNLNLQIGDKIYFQFPLYDPQTGIIQKIYSDSVIVENNLHVSEKYIIKKIENKETIKISELKVGDRVKYRANEGVSGTNHSITLEFEGYILEIYQKYGGFFQITKSGYYGCQTSVKFKDIISKLEPLPPKYKEILVEKEEKPAPKSFKFDIHIGTKDKTILNDIFYSAERFIKLGKSYTIEIKEKE